jgi:hypothetical protein
VRKLHNESSNRDIWHNLADLELPSETDAHPLLNAEVIFRSIPEAAQFPFLAARRSTEVFDPQESY